jgi:capsular polysaccharide transport system permease protein
MYDNRHQYNLNDRRKLLAQAPDRDPQNRDPDASDTSTTDNQSARDDQSASDTRNKRNPGAGRGGQAGGNQGGSNQRSGNRAGQPDRERGQGRGQGPAPSKPNQGKGSKPNSNKGEPEKVSFKPVAEPARMKRRHYGLIATLVIMVVLPVLTVATYLYSFAVDQYASTAGFTVRANEGGAATDLLGGLAQFAGGSTSGDADILFEFIESQEIVQRLNDELDLVSHFSAPYERDPYFALSPDATIEDLVDHWQSIVRVTFEQSSGLIDLRVLAFDPETAHAIASAIVEESQILVNELNEQARIDAMRFAQADLNEAIIRLRRAREALTEFRTRTQIVDPTSDLQGRMGVLNNLQQQLAEALIELDLLYENSANATDPRVVQAERRIDVIRNRIVQERQNFTLDDVGTNGEDYPTLMAEFEGIVVDREFAEESYRAALTAVDVARTNAARQSRYLAVFIRPTFPESAGYPRRELILALTALFSVLAWAILALVYYSIRDRQ